MNALVIRTPTPQKNMGIGGKVGDNGALDPVEAFFVNLKYWDHAIFADRV
jgi:hypothetical protein